MGAPGRNGNAASVQNVIDLCDDDDDDVRTRNVSTRGQAEEQEHPGHDSFRESKKRRLDSGSSEQPIEIDLSPEPKQETTREATRVVPLLILNPSEDSGNVTHGLMEMVDSQMTCASAATCTNRGPKSMQKDSAPGHLLSPSMDHLAHIQQRDKFSCGFRNVQMVLGGILPHLTPTHSFFTIVPRTRDTSLITLPSMHKLQVYLERSWKEGFDPEGCQHYGGKLVGKTGKAAQIGAVEVSSLFSYLGLDSAVIQFIKCAESRSALPHFVKNYFSNPRRDLCPYCTEDLAATDQARKIAILCGNEKLSPPSASTSTACCRCTRLPLYFQWDGHSVTIVGYQESPGKGAEFLIFDPLQDGDQILRSKRLPVFRWSTLQNKKNDFQIVLPSFRSLSPIERNARKYDHSYVVTAREDAVRRVMGR